MEITKTPQLQTTTSVIENCRYCLMCRHVCPVGHITRKETLTPHGWGLTIASVERGLISWNPETVEVLYSCADCGTCRTHCVTDQALPNAIAATRATVAAQGFAPAVAGDVHDALEKWGNPYQAEIPRAAGGKGDVALFVGDDAHFLWPAALEAALKLLAAAGVKPVLVGIGRSNGYLAASLGYPETARKQVQETLAELKTSTAGTMLVISPGDAWAFSSMMKERLGLEWPGGVKLQEMTAFLEEKAESGRLKFKPASETQPYSYVDPTHSLRLPGRWEAPRRLLGRALAGTGKELYWRKERTHPCGNGALQFTNPHISNHLNWVRLEDARTAGARVIFTEDPGCLSHLDQHAERFGLKVNGLYEVLAEHLV
jgi:Fe-S oxidoreductase